MCKEIIYQQFAWKNILRFVVSFFYVTLSISPSSLIMPLPSFPPLLSSPLLSSDFIPCHLISSPLPCYLHLSPVLIFSSLLLSSLFCSHLFSSALFSSHLFCTLLILSLFISSHYLISFLALYLFSS